LLLPYLCAKVQEYGSRSIIPFQNNTSHGSNLHKAGCTSCSSCSCNYGNYETCKGDHDDQPYPIPFIYNPESISSQLPFHKKYSIPPISPHIPLIQLERPFHTVTRDKSALK